MSMILAAKMLGYLSGIELSVILGILITVMGAGMLAYTVAKKLKKKKEEERKQDSERDLRRAHAKEERKEQEEKNVFREKTERDTEGLGRMPLQFRAGTIQENKSTKNVGETVVLSMNNTNGPPSLVSREPGELATIYIEKELVVIGKLQTASDAVIDLPTVSRVHAKIKKKEEGYYLTDLNSRNGTTVNGRLLKAEEEYCLQNEDEVAFAQARYVFLE